MEYWSLIINYIQIYLILPSLSGIIFLGVLKKIFKQKDNSRQVIIIANIFIFYSIFYLLYLISSFAISPKESEELNFLTRATGPYFYVFSITIISQSIIPLFLLFKKLKKSYLFILALSFLCNWLQLYEPFLIRMISLHRDILTSIDNPNFYYFTPSSREVSSITIGLILSSLLFFLTRKKPINKVQSVLDN